MAEDAPNIRIFFYTNENGRSMKVANEYASQGMKAYYVIGGLNVWKDIEG